MIIEEILTLPAEVTFEGVHFTFEIFINKSNEIRFCYPISYVDDDSPHKAHYDKWETWENKLRYPDDLIPEGWLYLQEGIDTDATLIWAIRECWYWLQKHGLLH